MILKNGAKSRACEDALCLKWLNTGPGHEESYESCAYQDKTDVVHAHVCKVSTDHQEDSYAYYDVGHYWLFLLGFCVLLFAVEVFDWLGRFFCCACKWVYLLFFIFFKTRAVMVFRKPVIWAVVISAEFACKRKFIEFLVTVCASALALRCLWCRRHTSYWMRWILYRLCMGCLQLFSRGKSENASKHLYYFMHYSRKNP